MMKKRREIKCETEKKIKERRQGKINHDRRGEETGRINEDEGKRDK
jgi:hypothetical protein